jgi:hypothetical protein
MFEGWLAAGRTVLVIFMLIQREDLRNRRSACRLRPPDDYH